MKATFTFNNIEEFANRIGNEFKTLIDCINERNYLLNMVEEVKNGTLEEFDLDCCIKGYKPYINFCDEEVNENKEFILMFLKVAIKESEKYIKEISDRLGIEGYEELLK